MWTELKIISLSDIEVDSKNKEIAEKIKRINRYWAERITEAEYILLGFFRTF